MTKSIAWAVPAVAAALFCTTATTAASAQNNPYAPANAGPGYAPPPPPPQSNAADEPKDSGLGLEWVWLNADAGFGYADLASFSQTTMGMQKTASTGPALGFGAGVRLLFVTLGVRVRDLMLSDIGDLWETGGEIAFHLRIWRVDPYLGLRGGYNFVGSLNSNTAQVSVGNNQAASIHGFDVGPMAGVDVYLAHQISIGAELDAEFLFISRPPLALPAGVSEANLHLTAQQKELYNNSGSSAGIQIAPTAHLGIHF